MTVQPKNRHVLFAECEEPATLKRPDGIDVAVFPLKQMVFGVVVAIDETPGPEHVCKVGDIVYCLDPNLGGTVRTDGGEILRLVRECFIIAVVSDVPAKRTHQVFTKEAFERVQRQVSEASQAAGQPRIAVPRKSIQLVQ